MSDASFLPKGWCCTSLEKIAIWGSGGTPSRSQKRYFQGTIPWIKTGELEDKYIRETEEHITEEALNNSSAKIFPKGSVGIAMYGATIGKLSIWGIDASTNQACAVGVPSEAINNELLYYYLLSERQSLIKAGKGGAQPNLSQGVIKEWPINLPPLFEQHRIVAKIEELFSELDKGIENLKTARAQLKVYRQALLKHAFEGKLTAQWRAERSVTPAQKGKQANCEAAARKAGVQPLNDMDSRLRGNDKPLETSDALLKRIQQERAARYQQQLADWQASGGSKPKAPKPLPPLTKEELAALPLLPKGWGWVRLGEITSIIAGNAFEKAEYSDSGVRLFQIANVSFGEIVWDKVVHLPEKYWDDYPELRLFAGDLVMALNRPLLGDDLKIGRLGLTDTPSILYQRVGKFVPHSNAVSNLIFWYLRSSYFISSLKKELRGVNIPFINQTRLMEYPVPLCDFDELAQISAELERSLSNVDQLEQTIDTSLQQSEALRQSILKKAFSGQLVPQDPHDESASALLARIKEERATAKENSAFRQRGKRG